MKKYLKIIGGFIMIFIAVYSCNKNISRKLEVDINTKLELEKRARFLENIKKKREIEQAVLNSDSMAFISSDIILEEEKEIIEDTKNKKNLTPLERLQNLTATKKEYKTNELTKFQPGTTTSMKQVSKAASAPAGQFDKVLNEK